MKFHILSLVYVASALYPLSTNPTQSLSNFQLEDFLGGWFEIGRTALIRSVYERQCDCVEANYALKADGVTVHNTCTKNGTVFIDIVGAAKQVDAKINTEFHVSFGAKGIFGDIGLFFQNINTSPNYVVKNIWIDDDGNYRTALIVVPHAYLPKQIEKHLQAFWIISRNSVISEEHENEVLKFAKDAGYDAISSSYEHTEQVLCRVQSMTSE